MLPDEQVQQPLQSPRGTADLRSESAAEVPLAVDIQQENASKIGKVKERDQVCTYQDEPIKIRIVEYECGIFADQWNLDTASIEKFDRKAIVQKIVEGPAGLTGKWIVRRALTGFGPTKFKHGSTVNRKIKDNVTDKYHSRDEFIMIWDNVRERERARDTHTHTDTDTDMHMC